MNARLLSASLLIPVAACASSGLGEMPTELIDLYDQALPTGVIEIEVERDGTIREIEADVPGEAVPARALDAALAAVPGSEITGAERELHTEGYFWEVKLIADGRAWEVVTDEEGEVHEIEQEIDRSEAPAAVLVGADAAVPGGSFVSVELITHGSEREYHVKKDRDGARFKIVLAPDGAVLRAVREQRAEIEIPLRRGS